MTPTGIATKLPKSPEPCTKGRCYSPYACEGFGYCRARNEADRGAPTPEQRAEHLRQAAEARAGAMARPTSGEEG